MNGDGGGSYVSRRGSARKPCSGGSCCIIFNFLPFHLSWTRTLVLPSVIFGIEHYYQGVAGLSRRGGAVQTMPIGLLLATMLLATGNLLLPMVVHAMLDCACGCFFRRVCPCGGEGHHSVDRSKIPILNAGEIRMEHPQRHRGLCDPRKSARRGFLKTAGVALGGNALIALPERAIALGARLKIILLMTCEHSGVCFGV